MHTIAKVAKVIGECFNLVLRSDGWLATKAPASADPVYDLIDPIFAAIEAHKAARAAWINWVDRLMALEADLTTLRRRAQHANDTQDLTDSAGP
jgi:hypothetical protein